MAMMRRINGIAVVGRAMSGVAASSASRNAAQQRLYQAALYSTSCNSSTMWSRWFSRDRLAHSNRCSTAQGVAGVMFFSVAASSLAEEVHAKEPLQYNKFAPKDVVLYQYEACPFCNKVKAFLDYYDIPYKIVEVNPLSKKEIKWSDYKKVPILLVDGEQMVDSSGIVNELLGMLPELCKSCNSSNTSPLYSAAEKDHLEVVNAILDADVRSIRIVQKNGKTALHNAVRYGRLRVVKALLDRDPEIISIKDKKGTIKEDMLPN